MTLQFYGTDVMDISKVNSIPYEYPIGSDSTEVVFRKDGIAITAFDVDLEPIEPAVGYAIEYNGKKVVLSGDAKKNQPLEEMAQDYDLLIHEVMLMSFQNFIISQIRNQ